jgi:hypothetical protein
MDSERISTKEDLSCEALAKDEREIVSMNSRASISPALVGHNQLIIMLMRSNSKIGIQPVLSNCAPPRVLPD